MYFTPKIGFISIECDNCKTELLLPIQKLDIVLKIDKPNQIVNEKPTLKIIK
jgi:hypothetical protein